ncbi:MAG: asparagine synthase (glutamine-hydrolyzing) [Candidatus Omnitrophica bacterium]|nr:asparagine synthase (glutamine-hydrolyzing) [Candidatus Omnitrophota bacterium]
MCGICGYIAKPGDKDFIAPDAFRAICRRLSNRGPDDEGYYFAERAALGHRRLSIIDLSTGKQPIHNENESVWVVLNGEIYNYLELREELQKKGHSFYTHSDTEVIVHLYEEHGEDCVKKLDGMFALCIWDNDRARAVLAKDPMGKKPLFWSIAGGKFVFASELKALLAFPGLKKEIDRRALQKYFSYGFIPAPATIYKGVNKLLPGNYLTVNKELGVSEKTYWRLDYSVKNMKDTDIVRGEIWNYFTKAVEKRLRSDVPLGVFLSGGIDSSLVTVAMTKLLPASQIHAFSIGFKENEFDESEYARMVAKHLGVHHEVKLFSMEEVSTVLPKVAGYMDEPMADPSILPTYLLSSFTSEYVKVALSGDGGDEGFGGYPKYLAHWFLKRNRIPLSLFSPFAWALPDKLKAFLRYAPYSLALRNQLWISPFSPQEVSELSGNGGNPLDDIERYHALFNGKDGLDEALFLDQKLTMADMYLVKVDRASMACALEVRSPFLDRSLVEYAARIPFKMKLRGGKTKALLKDIALDFLPPEIVNRPKKGFGIPLSRWLNHELRGFLDEKLAGSKVKEEGVINPVMAKKVLAARNPHQLWTLLVFELWYENWMKE